MQLVIFNTVMSVSAGLAMLLVPRAFAHLQWRRMPLLLLLDPARVSRHGWAATFGVLGLVLSSLGWS